jgi:hypothetical protein
MNDITLASIQGTHASRSPNSLPSSERMRFRNTNQAAFRHPTAHQFHAKWTARGILPTAASRGTDTLWSEDKAYQSGMQAERWRKIAADQPDGAEWLAATQEARAAAAALEAEVMSEAGPKSASEEWDDRVEASKLFKVATAWSAANKAWAAAEFGSADALRASALAAKQTAAAGGEEATVKAWQAAAKAWQAAVGDFSDGNAEPARAGVANSQAARIPPAARIEVTPKTAFELGPISLDAGQVAILGLLAWIGFAFFTIGKLVWNLR